jgi:WD40 repeat protein
MSIRRIAICGLTVMATWTWSGLSRGDDETKVTFDEHIKPIFREHCTICHSESDKSSDLALDSYSATLAGGSGGDVVLEGEVSRSRLWSLITHAEQPFMPPDQEPIPEAQRKLVKTWIEQGMPENSGSKIKRSNKSAMAMLATTSIGKPEGPPPMPDGLLVQPVIETKRSAAISALAASPWAPLIAVGGQEQISLYHSESGQLLGIVPFPEGEPQSLTFTRDGKQLLVGGGRHSHSGCAVLIDVVTGERITKVGDELDTSLAADIAPDKSKIALAGPQRMVRVFDSMSGDLLFQMKKHTDWVFALRFSPDGVLLASGDRSNGLIVWEADTGRLYAELAGHKGEVRSLDFRADSNVLATGSMDGTIKLWDMMENREVKSWEAHGGGVTAVAFARDGLIASAGRDGRVKLWNGNGELQREFTGLTDAALEVALTGDAAWIAGGDWSGHVAVWRADNPQQIIPIAANPPSIETRLAQATAELLRMQAEHDAANESALAAKDNALLVLAELEASRQTAAVMETQRAAVMSEIELSSASLGAIDGQIAELEQKLAQLRIDREQIAQRESMARQTANDLDQQHAVVVQSVTSLEARHTELAQVAMESETQLQQAATRLDAARMVVERANEAKQAFDGRAQELAEQAAAKRLAADSFMEQAIELVDRSERKKAEFEERSQELERLQQQLNELQQTLSAVQAATNSTAQQLEEARMQQVDVQGKLEEAQQAAVTAKEELELFQKAYGKPQ